jgi:hypothetical protein
MAWFPKCLQRVPPLPPPAAPTQPVCIHCQGQLCVERSNIDDGLPEAYRARCQRCDATGPLTPWAVDAMPSMAATSIAQLREIDPDNWPEGLK